MTNAYSKNAQKYISRHPNARLLCYRIKVQSDSLLPLLVAKNVEVRRGKSLAYNRYKSAQASANFGLWVSVAAAAAVEVANMKPAVVEGVLAAENS